MFKTERLSLKILETDKRILESIALSEGEPIAAIVRRMIRDGIRRAVTTAPQPIDAAPASAGGVNDAQS